MKEVIIFLIGIFSALYLINPGLGVFELIPDNISLIGNFDEAVATFLFLSSLSYFGIDLKGWFKGFFQKK